MAADAETAPRVRFTSSGDNFPFAGTLRAVSYSVIYDYSVCMRGQGIYRLEAEAGAHFTCGEQGTDTTDHAVGSGELYGTGNPFCDAVTDRNGLTIWR